MKSLELHTSIGNIKGNNKHNYNIIDNIIITKTIKEKMTIN